MTTIRRFRPLVSALVLLWLPRLAQAEVSVLVDQEGKFKKLVYIATGSEHHRVIWRQMRPSVPLEQLLNPQGDTLGDLPPIFRFHSLTGHPWVVWSMNVAGQKVIGFAAWGGAAWTAPRPVVTAPDPLYYDQVDPDLAFDETGRPFLVWTRKEPIPQVYFSTMIRGVWTPPLRISSEGIAAFAPSVTLAGTTATITYETESGPIVQTFETGVLLQSAANLMDTPIPPGNVPDPGDPGGGGSPGEEPPSVINKH